MRFLAIAPTLLLLAATAFAPGAQAAAAGCSLANPALPVPTPFVVVPPFLNALGPGTCTVAPVLGAPGPALSATGLTFVSGEAPCPPLPFVGPFGGQLCGPLVPGLGGVTCTASWLGANIDDKRALVLGLDYVVPLTADGNVVQPVPLLDHEPLRHSGPDFRTQHSVRITNPLPLQARVIAYPVDGPFSFGGPVAIGCL